MLRSVLAAGRYIVIVPILGTFLAALALIIYEVLVMATAIVEIAQRGHVSVKDAKSLAVGVIEAVDVFLIAIVAYIMSLGFYSLFVDNTLSPHPWLRFRDLDDLKKHLVGAVIAVLGVLFLREGLAWDGSRDLLGFGVALALIIVTLTFYLGKLKRPDD